MNSPIDQLIRLALEEDIGSGDITAQAVVPSTVQGSAQLIAKEEIVVAGLEVVQKVFSAADPSLIFSPLVHDGELVAAWTALARISGPIQSLLAAERTALNFLQHLCGIATLTRAFVKRLEGTKAQILDTRKTLPGFRSLEKEAVRAGGGVNHRLGLYDRYLIKNNHIAAAGGVKAVIAAVKPKRVDNILIEAECRTLDDVREAALEGIDWIMFDNMPPEVVRSAVKLIDHLDLSSRPTLEASGNMTLENVRAYAEAGVDFISVGKITHSAPAANIHMIIN